jgi:hypothetical protein
MVFPVWSLPVLDRIGADVRWIDSKKVKSPKLMLESTHKSAKFGIQHYRLEPLVRTIDLYNLAGENLLHLISGWLATRRGVQFQIYYFFST